MGIDYGCNVYGKSAVRSFKREILLVLADTLLGKANEKVRVSDKHICCCTLPQRIPASVENPIVLFGICPPPNEVKTGDILLSILPYLG